MTDTLDIYKTITKTGRPITKGKCKVCDISKNRFEQSGGGAINTLMNKIPLPKMHLSLP